MNVRELIALLAQFDPEASVVYADNSDNYMTVHLPITEAVVEGTKVILY